MDPHPALLVAGDDELGALAELHMKALEGQCHVYAATGVADGGGSFGYVIYVRPEQYNLQSPLLAYSPRSRSRLSPGRHDLETSFAAFQNSKTGPA